MDGVGRLFNIESGLLHTVHRLSTRPERVVRGYWSGATARYTHPAVYLLISFATFSLAARFFGGFTGGGDVERIAAITFIPLVAGASRLFLYRRPLNYAEHLILVMYATGHAALLFAVLLLVFPLFERSTTWLLSGAALVGGAIYVAWVYMRVFRRHALRDFVSGLAALVTGALIWAVMLVAFIRLIRR